MQDRRPHSAIYATRLGRADRGPASPSRRYTRTPAQDIFRRSTGPVHLLSAGSACSTGLLDVAASSGSFERLLKCPDSAGSTRSPLPGIPSNLHPPLVQRSSTSHSLFDAWVAAAGSIALAFLLPLGARSGCPPSQWFAIDGFLSPLASRSCRLA